MSRQIAVRLPDELVEAYSSGARLGGGVAAGHRRRHTAGILSGMTRKVAISLPDDLLTAIDQEGRSAGLSRSRVLATAARDYLTNRRREHDAAAYVQSYREHPETADEVAGSEAFLLRDFQDRA